MSTPAIAKKVLRKAMKKTLQSLTPPEIRSQSGLAVSHLMSHPAFKQARSISCYLSMPSAEAVTDDLVRTILGLGKILFVPRISVERGEIDMLRIYDENDLDSLPSGKWGIKEPTYDLNGRQRTNVMDGESPVLDLVILPGLAFDRSLSRLGHGKGYYDRFLSSYQTYLIGQKEVDVTMPLLLGLCLTQQIVEGSPVPVDETDWKVDDIVYPAGLISKQKNELLDS